MYKHLDLGARDVRSPINQSTLPTAIILQSKVRLWDARKPKKEIWGIPHTNSLNNATFNPTGSHMLVTCQVGSRPMLVGWVCT